MVIHAVSELMPFILPHIHREFPYTSFNLRPSPAFPTQCVPHGFRSSFRDWAAEKTDHPREVIEAALAHVVGNQTEAAYARSDLFERRRLLMDEWAAYLAATRRVS